MPHRWQKAIAALAFLSSVASASTWVPEPVPPTFKGALYIDAESIRHNGAATTGWSKIEWPRSVPYKGGLVRYIVAEWTAHCLDRRLAPGQALAYSDNATIVRHWPEESGTRSVPPDTFDEAIYKALCRGNQWSGAVRVN